MFNVGVLASLFPAVRGKKLASVLDDKLTLCNMPPHRLRISAGWRKDAVRQVVQRRHSIRRRQQIMQHQRIGAACSRSSESRKLHLLFAISELDPPAEQHAGDDPVAAADLGGGTAGKLGLFYNGALFFVGETAAANMFIARAWCCRCVCQAAFDVRLLSSAANTSA